MSRDHQYQSPYKCQNDDTRKSIKSCSVERENIFNSTFNNIPLEHPKFLDFNLENDSDNVSQPNF